MKSAIIVTLISPLAGCTYADLARAPPWPDYTSSRPFAPAYIPQNSVDSSSPPNVGTPAAGLEPSSPPVTKPDEGIDFGIAKVKVAKDSAYVCQNLEALLVANDSGARARMGELNYMQSMISGGCVQVFRGTSLTIRGLSEKKSEEGLVISPLGSVARMRDFNDWYGVPLVRSSLHSACHTVEGTLIDPHDGRTAPYRSQDTICGLEY